MARVWLRRPLPLASVKIPTISATENEAQRDQRVSSMAERTGGGLSELMLEVGEDLLDRVRRGDRTSKAGRCGPNRKA